MTIKKDRLNLSLPSEETIKRVVQNRKKLDDETNEASKEKEVEVFVLDKEQPVEYLKIDKI